KAFFALLQALHKEHPSDNLALAGGCAMNSVANGKVYRRTPFKKMYLPAAAGDAGGAIGAAALVLSQLSDHKSAAGDQSLNSDLRPLLSAYLGPDASEEEVHGLIDWKKKEIGDAGCSISYVGDEDELLKRTAQAIADEK